VAELRPSGQQSGDAPVIGLKRRVVHRAIRLAIPKATKWQRVENQIKAATIFARSDFLTVRGLHLLLRESNFCKAKGKECGARDPSAPYENR